jgi:hypothetical protein
MFTFPVGHFSSSGFEVDNSISFTASDEEYLTRTPANSATSRKKFTMSAWVKRASAGTNFPFFSARTSTNNDDAFNFTSGDKLEFMVDYTGDGQLTSNDSFASTTDWYHVLASVDTTQSTASNRIKLYVNGTQITSFSTANYPGQDYQFKRFQVSGNELTIGRTLSVSAAKADGLMAEAVWIDGQALTPSSFTSGTGSGIKPLDIEDQNFTFGNHGYYLPFTIAAGLGTDYSGSTVETKIQENTYAAGSEVNKTDMTNAGFTAGAKLTAVASAALPTVKIRASSTGFTSTAVRIETGTSTAPSGTLVDSNAEVTGITSSGAGLKTADFPNNGPVLDAGTTYWIVLANSGNWGWQHDVSGSGGALGIRDASGYQGGRGLGHEAYQLGNIFTPVNSPTQSSTTPTS